MITSTANPFFAPCDAYTADPLYPSVHTCTDPARCAVESLIAGPDPRSQDLERLHDLLDTLEEMCEESNSKIAKSILTAIHTERGGPR